MWGRESRGCLGWQIFRQRWNLEVTELSPAQSNDNEFISCLGEKGNAIKLETTAEDDMTRYFTHRNHVCITRFNTVRITRIPLQTVIDNNLIISISFFAWHGDNLLRRKSLSMKLKRFNTSFPVSNRLIQSFHLCLLGFKLNSLLGITGT